VAALGVEHELLSAKVAELKRFLEENQERDAPGLSEVEIQELECELANMRAENQELAQENEALGL